ncbi:DNA mismatch repair protein [Elizabethkingia argentiflava]|uniref:DNA mismatch repair protein n=1 Tax=Elizabethkingia argenteiflava TaxID=2681556 RepID=A0A845PUF3_9FLAO|nr:Smr/MutS family protein [Elizabethkingia argenteiflava]NAW51454.1 DNA mismatch repair protein [Elizabethkingia argenteiflava]
MKIGDHVSVLNDNLRGKIIKIQKNLIILEDEHGFEHSFKPEDLVPIEPDLYTPDSISVKQEPQKKVSKKNKTQPLILDLHFEQLVSNPCDYTPWERLFIQKKRLQESIKFCRKNKIKKLKVIHGIGDGVLQGMVLEVLGGEIDLEYEDGYFFKHQSGAIDVLLK